MEDIESNIKDNLNKIFGEYNKLNLNLKKINTLVLSGGGVKGIHYIGIIKKLEELNIINQIKTLCGTSIGAFFSVLINIGFSSKDLFDFILLFNLNKVNKLDTSNFFSYFGINDGNNLEIILENMFELKGFNKDINFLDLFNKTKIELTISGVCINEKQCHYFNYKNYPNMQVIKAVRISTSVPLYFTPVLFESKLWVDGAVIDNYPIHLFKHKINQVLGFYISEKKEYSNINNLEDYFSCVIQSLLQGLASKSMKGYENNTIVIRSDKINFINTNLTKENIIEMIDYGYDIITNYL